jgi:hypothetical protein
MTPYFIVYCKILSSVIKGAKRQHYCRLIAKPDNQIKAAWNIIKHERGKLHLTDQIPSHLINDEEVNHPEYIFPDNY